jgi:replication factor C large subunit
MQWTEKYRPKSFNEICGQEIEVEKIKSIVNNFEDSRKKAIILHGPPGVGKTTIAHVIAKETNSEIFELNASDLRNKEKLKEILKPAIEQKSLIKKTKIILIDEVDGISATDRGGLPELLELIEETTYPIIITANNIWDTKLSPLRKKAEMISLKEINYNTIKDVLFKILRKESLFLNNNLVTSIAVRAKGDLRAAINDMQSISRLKDPSMLTIDERNKETDIFQAIRMILKGKPTNEVLGILDSVKMPIDEVFLWLEENIPFDYSKEELKKAYDRLSKADLFKGRIYRKQYWRFLVYENIFLTYGISAAKKNQKTGFTNYKRPTRVLKIWMNNQRIAKKKIITQKYAEHVHIGEKRALKEFPILKQIIKSNPAIQKELRLTEEEIEYVVKN